MKAKPKIGVSRCLLGDAVRYDGQSRPCTIVIEKLAKQFELIAICPEVEAGLSIPRPPVQLRGDINNIKLIGRDDDNIDVTELMQNYCSNKIPELNELCGFILKSRSPSCGLNSTPIFNDSGEATKKFGSGLFAQALRAHYPKLPIIEEIQLTSEERLKHFTQNIFQNSRGAPY